MVINIKLQLKVIERKKDKIKFKIVYQSPSLRTNNDRIKDIVLLDDIKIKSSNYPEAQEWQDTFFIRGALIHRDDEVVECSKSFWNKIQKGLSVINNGFIY